MAELLASSEWNVSISEVRRLSWLITEPSQTGLPGETIEFLVKLLNEGNTAGQFNLSLSSNELIAVTDFLELSQFDVFVGT